MNLSNFKKISDTCWQSDQQKGMNVPVVIYADENIIAQMDDKVFEQSASVARLPGIVKASFALPDAHWGYGFPIGGVAGFDPDAGGVVSAGGVGFDISCGVRTLLTGLIADDVLPVKAALADALEKKIPAGVGSKGRVCLSAKEMDEMLTGGAVWAVERGFGTKTDLERIEEHGCMKGASARCVSNEAKTRQREETGTLGSGNHYLEVQKVVEVYDADSARIFGIAAGDIAVSIHCGSRGLGHQIATDYLKRMAPVTRSLGIAGADRELGCALLNSDLGRDYLGAMRAGINCALANRQVLSHLVREVFEKVLPGARLRVLYDVSHNTCKAEHHTVNGDRKLLYVHRKGATRAFGPGHPELPEDLRSAGQPVLIGGTMGTSSYIMAGTSESMQLAFGSAVHGAGRMMSRSQAARQWHGRPLVDWLASKGIIVRCPSYRGVSEEAPGAYKDVSAVVEAAHKAHLAVKVARLEPLICIKG
ncbi:MAG TPA: RtcB family protein [Sedimentisphaerales bacterium]|nr:RtcB family protein [Sedimentisphaerales bacterium]